MIPSSKAAWYAAIVAVLLLGVVPAQAYIGPGSGVSAVGTIVAVIGAGFLLLVGFVWYPIKRLLKRGKTTPETVDTLLPEEHDISQDADRDI